MVFGRFCFGRKGKWVDIVFWIRWFLVFVVLDFSRKYLEFYYVERLLFFNW